MATIPLKRPLRVPSGAKGPIPPPGPSAEQEDASPAPASPLGGPAHDPDEDEEDLDTPSNPLATIRAAAKARLDARKLPALPTRISFEEFCQYWRQLSPDQKSHLIVYIYRLRPVIDRQLVEGQSVKYIDCLGSDEQMSWEYMLNTHGGGIYQGLINDTDIRKNGQISEIKLEIPMSQYDPILNLAELDISHRENQVFVNKLKAKGILTSDGRINKNPSSEKAKEDLMSSSVVNRLLDAALAPAKTPPPQDSGISNLVLEMMKQNNPNNQLATLLAVVEKLKPAAPVEKPDSALEYLKLMEAQRTNFEARIAQLQEKIMELATRPMEKPDTLSEIEKIRAMAEALGMGPGGGKTSWVDRLIETVGPAIPGVVQIIQSRLSGPPAQAPGNPGIPRMPNDLDTALALPPGPGVPGTENMENGITPSTENGINVMAFLDTVINSGGDEFLNAIANGVPGYDAADAIIALRGRPIYQMIIRDGVPGLVEAIKRNQAFALKLSRITTEEKLNQWLHEFVHAEEYGDGDGEVEPEPEPKKEKKGKVN